MDLFATLLVQGASNTPEAELAPGSAIPIEAAICDGGWNCYCVVA
jgi:hypothetical protein